MMGTHLAHLDRLIRLGWGDTPRRKIPSSVLDGRSDRHKPGPKAKWKPARRSYNKRPRSTDPALEDWSTCLSRSERINAHAAEMRRRNMETFRRQASASEAWQRRKMA